MKYFFYAYYNFINKKTSNYHLLGFKFSHNMRKFDIRLKTCLL